jgi:hypothetical protein
MYQQLSNSATQQLSILNLDLSLPFCVSSQTKLMIEFSAVVFLKYKGAKIAFSGLNKAFATHRFWKTRR